MGIFSKFEGKMEDTFEGAAGKISNAPISPVQIAKKAEKQMRRETMVGAGKQYAPTLYTVLVNPDDDARLFGYYPTLAGETETYLSGKASQEGLVMDGRPLVRFIVDEGLKHGKFDIIAEMVAGPIVEQLRDEEMERYGLVPSPKRQRQMAQRNARAHQAQAPEEDPYANDAFANDPWNNGFGYGYSVPVEPEIPAEPQPKPPLPYVPEDEIDRSINYGEYTFNSEDFEDYHEKPNSEDLPQTYGTSQPVPDQQDAKTASTVAFAGAQGETPNHRTVRARLVDLTYHRPYDLSGTHVTIGRESGNAIVVQDINASRRHAEVRLNTQGIWVITDLSSMNGTLVNGVSVASRPLYPGDIVTIGKTDFEFTLA